MNKWQGWLSMAVITVLAVGAGVWGKQAEAGTSLAVPSSSATGGETTRNDGWDKLFSFADTSLSGSYHVSMQWYGHTVAAQQAYLQDQLPAILPEQVSGVDGELILVPAETGAHAMIRLEGEAGQTTRMLEIRQHIDALLAAAPGSMPGDWSIKLEGAWQAESLAADPAEALPGLAARLLDAKVNGSYRDKGILNLTYQAKQLAKTAPGSNSTSLQTALHLDSLTGEWKLAIGAPMLTGEF